MGKYEVSNKQWNECFKDGGCAKKAELNPGEGLNHPVVRVNWHEAWAYAQWYSKKTGQDWRLPTDHEWFYAAGEGKDYKVEEKEYDYSDLEKIREIPKKTYPRGHFGENAWGMADTLGNVWEWTITCWAMAEDSLLAPVVPSVLNDPEKCATRITGGENRSHIPDFISDTYNGGCASLKPAANLGFRLVREVQP